MIGALCDITERAHFQKRTLDLGDDDDVVTGNGKRRERKTRK